ncbi:HNH endonuclease [Microbulbifer sp. CNSA002]|uniref:HNH endonuclease n=1 Tax=Microbulbifer sp. CNSA002 TaxID=3373604 RepID=UPI0039B53BAC
MTQSKKCKDCGNTYPESRDYFGQFKNKTSNGVKIGFRNSCRKCMAKRTAKHSSENPDLVRKRLDRRKIQSESAVGEHTSADLARIRIQLEDRCRFCNAELNGAGEVEHLTPVSRGGSHYAHNISLSCLSCNREKTNKTLDEYMVWRTERKLSTRNISLPYEKPDKPTVVAGRKYYDRA